MARPAGTPTDTPAGTPAGPAPDGGRDRAGTEQRLLDAVGQVLARDGFAAIGVNAIARQAGVDKVLIYRYFGGLPALLTQWGGSGRFWPGVDELLGADAQRVLALPVDQRWALFFERFIDALRARPLTLEILAAELVNRNELTTVLETEREHWGEQVEAAFGGDAVQQRPELRGLTLLLVAGVQHLLLRSRGIRVFGGVDLRSDDGWAMLKQSLRAVAGPLLAAPARSTTAPALSPPSAAPPPAPCSLRPRRAKPPPPPP